jgi:hypothetical protein
MPLATALASLKNPAASRTAILQRLGIDPNRAAGYGGNTQFDQQMSDLYRQGLKTSTDLDVEEGNVNRGYQRNFAQAAIDRDKALQAIKNSYAMRGMSYSGMNVDEQNENMNNYTRYTGDLGADRDANLNAIGRNRLNLAEGLTSGRMAAESGYGDDVGAFLQQQAIDLWNSTVAANQQQQMMQSLAAPAPRAAPTANYSPVARQATVAPARPTSNPYASMMTSSARKRPARGSYAPGYNTGGSRYM